MAWWRSPVTHLVSKEVQGIPCFHLGLWVTNPETPRVLKILWGCQEEEEPKIKNRKKGKKCMRKEK
jgi:hypothetical protein